MSSPQEGKPHRSLSYGEALLEATRQEMQRDQSVFVMGQGVDDARGMFGTTLDLHKEFGAERSFDVPLAEEGMTGVGIGAAMAGMRPIQVHQRMDFMLLCMNQLVNMAAKMSYMFAGAHKVPHGGARHHRPKLGTGRAAQPGVSFLFYACARPPGVRADDAL